MAILSLLTDSLTSYTDDKALHIAAQLGRADVIDILMKSPDINDTIKNGSQKQAFELVKNPDIAHHMQRILSSPFYSG